jgi:hypothetical protein
MRNPFDEYRRVTIDIGIEQTLGSDVSLMPPSVVEPRFTDSVNHKNDGPGGIPADDDEEIEGPISELIISQIRYCAELSRLLRRDVHDLIEDQRVQNRCITAKTFLNEFTEGLELLETIDVKRHLFKWTCV